MNKDVQKTSTRNILKKNLNRLPPDLVSKSMVVLHNIRSMHNVGAAFRSSDAFGIGKVVLTGFTPKPPRPEISKTAIGAEKNIPWQYFQDFSEFYKEIHREYLIIGIEQTNLSISLSEFQPAEKPVCMVFGNEVTGIDEEVLPYIDTFVEILQYGKKHSLNVSVAIGICIHNLLQKYRQDL